MFKKNTFLTYALIALTFLFSGFTNAAAIDLHEIATLANAQQESPKICLTMIVKNESRIIERFLDSVKEVIDCISICDTGSTDNTVHLIEQYMQKNNIPGKVHHHTWKNFGHNRTLSVEEAQKTISGLGLSLRNTFLLHLDADMLLVASPEFSKQSLCKDEYLIIQKNSDQSYYNSRLLRASLPWRSVGVTHEYWSLKIPHSEGKLQTLMIDDRGDGGCKADKFERDIRLLIQGLKDEPNNERYMFYLAQSYKCIQDYDQAIKWYAKRIEKGGWLEEVWYSHFMMGECYQEKNDWNNALKCYMEAYQYNPARSETLQKIANHYRLQGKNQLAYMYAKHGSQIPYPKDQILFISHNAYNYQFDEEISIAAFYTAFKEEGFDAANRLILNKNAPESIRTNAYRNLIFYVSNLKNTIFKPIHIELPLIYEGSSFHFNPANPSIVKTDDGYKVICRTVNYTQNGAMNFPLIDPTDPNKTIRTRNFLLHYNRDLNLLSQHEIIEDLPRKKYAWRSVEGLEDCRLVNFNNETWFTYSANDVSPKYQIQISLAKLTENASDKSYKVEKLVPLIGPDPNRCEKNWLPFTLNNELHVIYGYDPFTIYKVDAESGKNEIAVKYEPKYSFSGFRGSAAPIPFKEGYLMMVHEIGFTDRRFYFHRFLYLNKDFIVQKASKPFTFKNKGVEFCLAMTADHSESNLIMAVGIEDREAYLCQVDFETVQSILEELP